MTKYDDWKSQPAPLNWLDYIKYIQEYGMFPLPKFTGTTKVEAVLYIEEYMSMIEKERKMDMQKIVIKGLKQCMMNPNSDAYETQCYDCPYFVPDGKIDDCRGDLLSDAIELIQKGDNHED